MPDWPTFATLLAAHARRDVVMRGSVLFGADLDMASVAFLEFILGLEEAHDLDIDVESLDGSVRTAGQLYDRIFAGDA